MTTKPSLARAASAVRALLRRRRHPASPEPADLGTAFGLEATLEAHPESRWPAPTPPGASGESRRRDDRRAVEG